MNNTLTCERKGGAYLLSPNDTFYPTAEQLADGQIRGEITTRGPWQIITGYRALAVSGKTWEGKPLTVYGFRSLNKARECGHELEGRVSVNGKTYRGFTTSVLFELPDGKLIDVAAIHVCND